MLMELIEHAKSELMRVAQSVDWGALWDRSQSEFLKEVYQANVRFLTNTQSYYGAEFLALLVVILANFAIDIIASYILSRRTKSTILLCIAEVLGLSKVLLAWFLPGSPMRLLYGLVIFASGLGVHARVCDQLQLNEERPDGSVSRFFHEAFNTLYFNVLSRMDKPRGSRLPHLFRMFHGASLLVLIDLCTYIIREWIPIHVSPANQSIAMATAGGVWVVFSMEMSYIGGIVQSDLMGIPMSMELRHRHPLMSNSLAEFWGIRWNPIVGKLLQDSFYKPCRRLGVSRAGCVLACFTGSALLHAVPQYLATRNGTDCSMMFAFFFLQGVCLMIEVAVQKLCGVGKKKRSKKTSNLTLPVTLPENTKSPGAESPVKKNKPSGTGNKTTTGDPVTTTVNTSASTVPHPSVAHKTAPCQFPAELLTVVFVLSTSYLVLECMCVETTTLTDAQKDIWLKVAVTSGIGASVLYYYVRNHIYRALKLRHKNATITTSPNSDDSPLNETSTSTYKPKHYRIPLRTFILSYLGWLWMLVSVVLLLPLFALPVLHAVEPLYSQSFVVGSVLRTFEKVVVPVFAKCI